ncbi:neuronal membrane glycoprotein M6-b-like [Centruroides sculpturatus]|uniref:neuronal membrane glycoprotein M6-b-like n=1 Tax=Centruroides sculpturatus TaxID=218467 RepID=UPI000C6EC872|nr:neuronal membrane glycoprotein M6-b-like [Centruroides sculpturatus]
MTRMFNKSYSYSSISDKGCRARVCCCGDACCSGGCMKCMTRIPYATLIATILCCTGVGIFLGSFYRAIALTLRMFEEVFKYRFHWLSDMHIIFIGIGATMGGLSLILLLVGFLATGATREKVYRGWKSRVGGRITCAIFMVITYILELIWLLVLISMVVITFICSMWWGMCNNLNKEADPNLRCIDLRQFSLDIVCSFSYKNLRMIYKRTSNIYSLLRNNKDSVTKEERAEVYKIPFENQQLGIEKDYVGVTRRHLSVRLREHRYNVDKGHNNTILAVMVRTERAVVEPSEVLFILSLASSLLVVISLVNYLMCLSANYARIKDNEKFQDLQELQYLQETELETLPKDRF